MRAGEDIATRRKRLYMRSIRRGIKEMDLILGGFADRALGDLTVAQLDAYEAVLSEHDHDLYQWVSGQAEMPPEHAEMLTRIASDFRQSGAARG
ncbi:MAG: succinate dehydrogenase assembly factor 2 [Pseudomonadota bacterium]